MRENGIGIGPGMFLNWLEAIGSAVFDLSIQMRHIFEASRSGLGQRCKCRPFFPIHEEVVKIFGAFK